jgi:hypothetical protein
MISLNEYVAGSKSRAITELEPLCAAYDGECVKLEEQIAALEADLEAVKAKHLRGLKKQAAIVAAREAELHSAVEGSPELFVKPRTFVMHGCKVGFTSSTGSVDFEDEAYVIKQVEKHFKTRFDELVKTEYTPRKDALRTLTALELAKLGCRIDGAVEKLINKLIEKLVSAMVKDGEAQS